MNSQFQPENPIEDGVPLLPNVAPVIVLQGSDFNMGRQYAKQLYEVFGAWSLEDLKRTYSENDLCALKAYNAQIEKYTPEFVPWLQGMVAGAKEVGVDLHYRDVLAEFCTRMGPHGRQSLDVYPGEEPPESLNMDLRAYDCSGIAAWGEATKDGKLIGAATVDHETTPYMTIVVLPEEGNAYLYAGCIPSAPNPHPGMNSAGVAYVHHGAQIWGEDRPGYGVPGFFNVQHALRYANSVEEAIEIQMSYPAGNTASGLWADVSGNACNLTCRNPKSDRRPGDYGEEDFLYVTNTNLEKWLEPYLQGMGLGHSCGWPVKYFEHGGWNQDDMNSVRRNIYIWNMLHNYKGEIDFDFIKMMVGKPGNPPTNPDMEAAAAELQETQGGGGWEPRVCNMGNMYVAIMQPEKGDKGRFYVCTGAPNQKAEALTQHYFFFFSDPTYTYYELQLAADAQGVAQAARWRGKYDLYYANRTLRDLTYHDVAYAPLKEIFSKAAREFEKADYFLKKAAKAEGDEAINLYAKATRYFTRAQVLGKRITESMTPPPESPEELGLKEWMGDWGEWAPDPYTGE